MLNESPPLSQEIKETEIDGCESLKGEGWGKKCVDVHKEKWNMYFVMQLWIERVFELWKLLKLNATIIYTVLPSSN